MTIRLAPPGPQPIHVVVDRGGHVESAHRVHVAVAAEGGRPIEAWGAPRRPTFPRSAVKVIQALPLVESGAADRFGFGTAELALACSSHSGTPLHVDIARGMLARAGLGAEALECGAHWPLHADSARALARADSEPSALHNNCSGKHAGFLATAVHLGLGTGGYVTADHPLQRRVTAALSEMTGLDLGAAERGVEGCSIPTYAVPLERLAAAFAVVGTGAGLPASRAEALLRLRRSVALHPALVAGPGRFDTLVSTACGERVFVKSGAEGVLCAAIPSAGIGIAAKAEDGAARAVEAAMATLLLHLLPGVDEAERGVLESLALSEVHNCRGSVTGRVGVRRAD